MVTITRKEVASMLGVSVATVRRMEGKSLHPKLIDGAWRFEIDDVKGVQRAPSAVVKRAPSEGEIAAEIFRRFDEGKSLRQIVRECRQPPKVIRAMHEEWAAPLGRASDVECCAATTRDEEEIVRWEEAMRAMIEDEDEPRFTSRVCR